MWTLLQIEVFKIFKRPRTYISFVAITIIISLIQLAFYADGGAYMDFAIQALKDRFEINGQLLNGYFICYLVLQMLLVQVPLLIALVAGDVLSGEANMGTLRMLLTKPVSRTTIVVAKFIAALIYTVLLLTWMAILSLLVSMLIFGTDDLLIFKSDKAVLLREADVLWRFAGAFVYATIAMTTVTALALLLSVFGENSIGPIVGTMSIIILFTILTGLELPFFDFLKPILFTRHMLAWKGFFSEPVNFGSVIRSGCILIAHIVVFTGAAILIFRKKDILS
ncbi:MAG TPA: ABC transporter permease subunit [Chitinophagaceae bacterium]|nr:ABC transporter permease subunit [Chitinophagaceae bacterium]